MIVDFDGDVSLAKKETIMLEPSSKIRLDRTIMPLYDQALMKDVNLELIPINLKEGDCYVINHGKGMMVVDFGGYLRRDRYIVNRGKGLTTVNFSYHVSLTEKEGAGMTRRGDPERGMRSRKDGA
ncbi:hypothetical protein BHE74_00052891 [Ensete ventricosum]|nr:hypothetical protein BHE74_00052891 [Ensete ventricosum]